MYSKPVVTDKLELIHTAYKVDFDLHNNITILMGDSGSGKTTVFDIMQEAAVEDNRLLCINYISKTRDIDIEKIIMNAKGKLVVIDNADIILTDKLRKHIALDNENQYIIIGRNPSNLLTTRDNLYELDVTNAVENTTFRIKPYL